MTAKEFLRKEDYNENSKGYVLTFQEMSDLLEEYAKQKVAEALGCEFVELFENWDKPRRGVKDWVGQIVVKEKVKNYVGKVVYVLDDFVTTGQTLQRSCKALTSLEIHPHGVAFMLWS